LDVLVDLGPFRRAGRRRPARRLPRQRPGREHPADARPRGAVQPRDPRGAAARAVRHRPLRRRLHVRGARGDHARAGRAADGRLDRVRRHHALPVRGPLRQPHARAGRPGHGRRDRRARRHRLTRAVGRARRDPGGTLVSTSISRRSLLTAATGIGVIGALTACSRGGGGSGSAEGGGTGSGGEQIRFTFWGPAFYQEFTGEMVDAFTEAHPEIQVSLEPSEWGGYWDRLATQVAANDEPDVINMDGKYLAEYAGRGMLADLEQLPIDLSHVADADLDSGRLDGTPYAVSTGQNAWVLFANPAVFEAAGLDLPDD